MSAPRPTTRFPAAQAFYELDEYGYFGSSTYNRVTYTSAEQYGTFLDAGSNSYYISDAATLGTTDCTDSDYYCPSSTLTIPLQVAGTNGTSTTLQLPIANADTLLTANPSFAALTIWRPRAASPPPTLLAARQLMLGISVCPFSLAKRSTSGSGALSKVELQPARRPPTDTTPSSLLSE